ncbi:hypothetical protein, partial [Caldithrix abyssi]
MWLQSTLAILFCSFFDLLFFGKMAQIKGYPGHKGGVTVSIHILFSPVIILLYSFFKVSINLPLLQRLTANLRNFIYSNPQNK